MLARKVTVCQAASPRLMKFWNYLYAWHRSTYWAYICLHEWGQKI